MAYDFSRLESEVKKIKEWLAGEIAGVRAGSASPQLVENIKADYYGTPTPIKHMAAIHIADARTIIIQPWDKNAIPPIEKAILQSDVGIAPIVDKDAIRLTLPELTGERRAQLAKIVKEKLEEARIALRNERHEVWEDIQNKEKDKEISEDEKFRLKDELQKKVATIIKELESIVEKKVKEIES